MLPKDVSVHKTYPEDPARVVCFVGDTATAHPPLSHDGVETLIRDGHATTARRGLSSGDEGVHCSITAVLLLDLSVASAAGDEDESTSDRGHTKNTDHSSYGNANRLG